MALEIISIVQDTFYWHVLVLATEEFVHRSHFVSFFYIFGAALKDVVQTRGMVEGELLQGRCASWHLQGTERQVDTTL